MPGFRPVLLFSRPDLLNIEETWQTLVAIMLGQETGHWWRADATNLLFISSAEATSVFSKTDFWTDAVFIGTVRPQYLWTPLSDSDTEHNCPIYLRDILMDLRLKLERLFLSKQHSVPHRYTKRNSCFSPRSPLNLISLLFFTCHSMENGLGCK